MRCAVFRVALIGLVAAMIAFPARAGDLTPPAGPVAPSMKSLDEVEPRVALSQETAPGGPSEVFLINEPGSYYLTGDLDVPAMLHGIRISADNVTVDLNGFTIGGVPGGAPFGVSGITTSSFTDRTTIRNGTIQDMPNNGISLNGVQSAVENVATFRNRSFGINASGAQQVRILNCSSRQDEGGGIWVGSNSVVTGTTVAVAGGDGFTLEEGSVARDCVAHLCDTGFSGPVRVTLENCTSSENSEAGISLSNDSRVNGCLAHENVGNGIRVGTGSTVTESASFQNGGNGVETSTSAVVTGVSSYNNGGSGIVTGDGSSISNSVVFGSDATDAAGVVVGRGSSVASTVSRENANDGFDVGAGSTVTGCTVRANSGNGFDLESGCTIVDCTARTSGIVGITADTGSTIERCTAHANTTHGIWVTSGCTVRGNTCRVNGFENTVGSGILLTGSDNLIEHNNCNRNVNGIDAISSGSVIRGNTVSGSSGFNWNVVAGNVCQVISATTSGAIIGDSGGTFSGTSNPNANFTY